MTGPGEDPRAWQDHAMWWHVYPLGAVGAPIRPSGGAGSLGAPDEPVVHRLPRLAAWLDHVVGLGLNGLLLGPVFAAETHGYDTVDHLRVDPRLGDEQDLLDLVAAAHARGVRVALDGVFNHVGRSHPAFARLAAEGPTSPAAALFRLEGSGWGPGDAVPARVFEGHERLAVLDHDSPAVADLVVEVMTYWLDRGVDGWRLDAAYAVPPGFWVDVVRRVRETHPGAWFSGEVIHGDAAGYVAASGLDSVTQYELWQATWHAIADRNFFELAHAVERGNALLSTFTPTTFLGNHDTTRIASAVGRELVPHALAVLLTVAGTPCIYAGDEHGWEAVKEEREGGDDAVRPELAEQPPTDLDPAAAHLLAVHQQLIGLRRRHPWLVRAQTDVVELANRSVLLRTATAGAAVVTALNLDDAPVELPAAGARTVAAGEAELVGDRVRLPARGWAVLEG